MSLDETFQAGLDAIIAAHGGVALVMDGVTGTGLRVRTEQPTEYGINGETGVLIGTIRASGAVFGAPAENKTIMVAGEPAVVTSFSDSGGVYVINYRKVRQVAGV
jgi:hypothetical protein